MNEYLEVLPLKRNWICLGGGSGSSGGGGGTTTTNNNTEQNNKMMTWEQYVPGVTSSAYNKLIPQLESRAYQGLTPQEQAYYTGQGMNQAAVTQGAAQKSLQGNLSRSGARGPAVNEAYGDLGRQQVMGNASVMSNIQGMDVAQKGANTDRLMKGIALPNAPIVTGTTGATSGTTNYQPAKSSGSSGGS